MKILFYGDSLSSGFGVHFNELWVNILCENLNFKCINKSRNGETTASLLMHFEPEKYDSDIIFIMAGSNDLLSGKTPLSIEKNIEILIKEILSLNKQAVLGIPPKIYSDKIFMPSSLDIQAADYLPELKDRLFNLSEKYHTGIIDFYSLSELDKSCYIDGIHLNKSGHFLMYKKASELFSIF